MPTVEDDLLLIISLQERNAVLKARVLELEQMIWAITDYYDPPVSDESARLH